MPGSLRAGRKRASDFGVWAIRFQKRGILFIGRRFALKNYLYENKSRGHLVSHIIKLFWLNSEILTLTKNRTMSVCWRGPWFFSHGHITLHSQVMLFWFLNHFSSGSSCQYCQPSVHILFGVCHEHWHLRFGSWLLTLKTAVRKKINGNPLVSFGIENCKYR